MRGSPARRRGRHRQPEQPPRSRLWGVEPRNERGPEGYRAVRVVELLGRAPVVREKQEPDADRATSVWASEQMRRDVTRPVPASRGRHP